MVSVLMTAYNREKLIGYAIESVLASTYSDFELIIVDDNSTDNTFDIALKYAEQDKRISVYSNTQNLGDYPNRNYAATLAKRKYIKYVDSDDAIYPYCLQVMVNGMERFPEAAIGIATMEPNRCMIFPLMLNSEEAYRYHFFEKRIFHKGPLDAIIKRDAFNTVGKFLQGRMISDTDFWFRIVLHYPIVLLPEGLVWQRRHEHQELSDANKFLLEKEKIKWRYLLTPECKLQTGEIILIKNKQLKTFLRFSISEFLKFHFSNSKAYIKCFFFVLNLKIKNRINKRYVI